MKPLDLSLIENIGVYACKLISAHPSLCSFGRNLSTADLGQLAEIVQSECNAGKPVCPPTEFILEVKQVVPQRAWRKLITLLEKWHHQSGSEEESSLRVHEHECLIMGVLWQTLLITECRWRYAAIREEFAAIGTTA